MNIKDVKTKLGLRFKELRSAKGLKQEDLEKLGFSSRYYGKIERGVPNLKLETMIRLCGIFEISLADLFMFLESGQVASEDREAVAVKVTGILKGDVKKVRKLRLFLDEIL